MQITSNSELKSSSSCQMCFQTIFKTWTEFIMLYCKTPLRKLEYYKSWKILYVLSEKGGKGGEGEGIQTYADVCISLWNPQSNTNKSVGSST